MCGASKETLCRRSAAKPSAEIHAAGKHRHNAGGTTRAGSTLDLGAIRIGHVAQPGLEFINKTGRSK
jgi:hypothetical protein